MKAHKRKYIFISSDIKKDSDQLKIIEKCIYHDLNQQYCKIIREKDLLVLIEGSEDKKEEIRFGCVTPHTESMTIVRLLKNTIPVLFFGPDKEKRYEVIAELKLGIDLDLLNEMIFDVNQLDQISGAIRWVHLYYYHLKEKMNEREKQKLEEYGEYIIRREQAIAKENKAIETAIANHALRTA